MMLTKLKQISAGNPYYPPGCPRLLVLGLGYPLLAAGGHDGRPKMVHNVRGSVSSVLASYLASTLKSSVQAVLSVGVVNIKSGTVLR